MRAAFAAGWDLIRSGRYDRVAAVFDDDVVYVDHRTGHEPIAWGREALPAMWGPLFERYEIGAEVIDVPGRELVLTREVYAPKSGDEETVETYGLYTVHYGRISRGEFFAEEQEARAAASQHVAT